MQHSRPVGANIRDIIEFLAIKLLESSGKNYSMIRVVRTRLQHLFLLLVRSSPMNGDHQTRPCASNDNDNPLRPISIVLFGGFVMKLKTRGVEKLLLASGLPPSRLRLPIATDMTLEEPHRFESS